MGTVINTAPVGDLAVGGAPGVVLPLLLPLGSGVLLDGLLLPRCFRRRLLPAESVEAPLTSCATHAQLLAVDTTPGRVNNDCIQERGWASGQPPVALLLGEEGGDEGLGVGALGGPGLRVQRVFRLDAPHDGVHRLPLRQVLQLQQ